MSFAHTSSAAWRYAWGSLPVVCSQVASSFGFKAAGTVGCAWIACLQAATACCSASGLAPAAPCVTPLGVLVAGVVRAPVGDAVLVARLRASACVLPACVERTRAGAGPPVAPGAGDGPRAGDGPSPDEVERVLAAAGLPVPAGVLAGAAGVLAAAAGVLGAGAERPGEEVFPPPQPVTSVPTRSVSSGHVDRLCIAGSAPVRPKTRSGRRWRPLLCCSFRRGRVRPQANGDLRHPVRGGGAIAIE
jgi:hypothetical protein